MTVAITMRNSRSKFRMDIGKYVLRQKSAAGIAWGGRGFCHGSGLPQEGKRADGFLSYVIERMSYVKKHAAGIAIGRKKFATEAACHRWGGGRGGRERRMNIFAAWGWVQ